MSWNTATTAHMPCTSSVQGTGKRCSVQGKGKRCGGSWHARGGRGGWESHMGAAAGTSTRLHRARSPLCATSHPRCLAVCTCCCRAAWQAVCSGQAVQHTRPATSDAHHQPHDCRLQSRVVALLRMAPKDVQQLLHHTEPVVEQLHTAVDLQVFGHLRLGVDGEEAVGSACGS